MTNKLSKSGFTVLKLGVLLALPSFFVLTVSGFSRITLQVENASCYLSSNQFTLQWIHSVEKEHWKEHYQQQGEQLLLTRSEFKTYGAGTPNIGTIVQADAGLITYQVNRTLDELNWVVSSNVQSTLEIKNQPWRMYRMLPDYTAINIRIKRYSLWQLLTWNTCDEQFTLTHH